MPTRYHGSKAIVRINGSIVAQATWTLDKSTQKVDVTEFGDTNMVSVQGLPAVKGTLTGFWDSSDLTFLAASENATGASIVLYPSSLAGGVYHYGPAWLDYKMEVDVKGAVKVSGSFEANGSWSHQGL